MKTAPKNWHIELRILGIMNKRFKRRSFEPWTAISNLSNFKELTFVHALAMIISKLGTGSASSLWYSQYWRSEFYVCGRRARSRGRALVSNWAPSSGVPMIGMSEQPAAGFYGTDSSSSVLSRSKLRLLAYLFSSNSQKNRASPIQTGIVVSKRDLFNAAFDDDVEPSEFLG